MTKRTIAALVFTLIILGGCMIWVDVPLTLWAHGLPSWVVGAARDVTDIGKSTWWLIISGVSALMAIAAMKRGLGPAHHALARRIAAQGSFIFIAIAGSGLITDVIKIAVGKARPNLLFQNGYYGFDPFSFGSLHHSFPSGHANTLIAAALAMSLIWPRLRWPLFVLGAGLALTRVIVGAHYLSDTIAGGGLAVLTTLYLRDVYAARGWLFVDRDDRQAKGTRP
jgi:membrane-associated phospholipid phosphatase